MGMRSNKFKTEMQKKINESFRDEIRFNVEHKLHEINHFVAGVDSPFGTLVIADVQDHLRGIEEALGIKADEN